MMNEEDAAAVIKMIPNNEKDEEAASSADELLVEEGGGGGGPPNDDDDDDVAKHKEKPSDDDDDPPATLEERRQARSWPFDTNNNNTRNRDFRQQLTNGCTPVVWCTVLVLVLIGIIVILSMSLRKLSSTEYGVKYNRHNKHLDDAALTGGLHIGPPGFRFIKFPSTQITVDLPDDTCISQDGLRVQFSVTFQYQLQEKHLQSVILTYRDYSRWANIVEAAGKSAVQHACSLYTISNFQNKRGEIQLQMQQQLKLKLEGNTLADGSTTTGGVYATAMSLQLRNVNLPEAYQGAIGEKQAAAEDIVLAQNQRIQEVTKAQTTLLSAQEQVKSINNTAVNEADILVTESRIQAQSILYAYETETRAMVLAKSTLNLTIDGVLAYLSNQLVDKATNVTVTTAEPASLSRKGLL